ncbi:hypothetical protein EVAR_102266_1 [Eumeta japonica]|uniref:Uncharacterized protein n=1 Tax=Eumeta variegata TaxID=151549 RepID=A0A4C1WG00_EUMVA|nr:hypothetical protein EVAR_102266_1 [Eumeta japonica]
MHLDPSSDEGLVQRLPQKFHDFLPGWANYMFRWPLFHPSTLLWVDLSFCAHKYLYVVDSAERFSKPCLLSRLMSFYDAVNSFQYAVSKEFIKTWRYTSTSITPDARPTSVIPYVWWISFLMQGPFEL